MKQEKGFSENSKSFKIKYFSALGELYAKMGSVSKSNPEEATKSDQKKEDLPRA